MVWWTQCELGIKWGLLLEIWKLSNCFTVVATGFVANVDASEMINQLSILNLYPCFKMKVLRLSCLHHGPFHCLENLGQNHLHFLFHTKYNLFIAFNIPLSKCLLGIHCIQSPLSSSPHGCDKKIPCHPWVPWLKDSSS